MSALPFPSGECLINACLCGVHLCEASGRPLLLAFDLLLATLGFSVGLGCAAICKLKNHSVPFVAITRAVPGRRMTSEYTSAVWVMTGVGELAGLGRRVLVFPQCSTHVILGGRGLP